MACDHEMIERPFGGFYCLRCQQGFDSKSPAPMSSPKPQVLDVAKLLEKITNATDRMAVLEKRGKRGDAYEEAMLESVYAAIADVHDKVFKANKK